MSERKTQELEEALVNQLAHLKKYGELVERQRNLIEEGDYKGLLDILTRKDKVLARMGDPLRLGRLVADSPEPDQARRERTGRLFEELIARLDFFAASEAECMEKASGMKAELAGGIFTLRKGKRMLRRYSQAAGGGKARFKDLSG